MVGPAASPGKALGRLGVDMREMDRFRARAMGILSKSRDPARCLQLMRIKADSILGLGVFSGGTACCPLEISCPQGAMVATDEDVQTTNNWTADCPVETVATPSVLAGAGLDPPVVGELRGHLGKEALPEFAQETEVQVELGATNESVGVILDVCLDHTQFEKTKELNTDYDGKFRNVRISRVCFPHGVLVEENPDPGGWGIVQGGEDDTSRTPLQEQDLQEKGTCRKKQLLTQDGTEKGNVAFDGLEGTTVIGKRCVQGMHADHDPGRKSGQSSRARTDKSSNTFRNGYGRGKKTGFNKNHYSSSSAGSLGGCRRKQ